MRGGEWDGFFLNYDRFNANCVQIRGWNNILPVLPLCNTWVNILSQKKDRQLNGPNEFLIESIQFFFSYSRVEGWVMG